MRPIRFHAALPVSDNRMLVSGGCSSIGALQDIHVFNVGEDSVYTSDFCSGDPTGAYRETGTEVPACFQMWVGQLFKIT